MRLFPALPVFAFLILPGCVMRVGPKTIKPDRFDYTAAIGTSWKAQMLTNLVKIRYTEPPLFMDVAQVVTQYSWEAAAEIHTPDWTVPPLAPGASVSGRWAESPTITYNPMTGDKFTKSLLQPIAPASLFELVEAGWPIDIVFALAVRAINGIHSVSYMQVSKRAADEQFSQLLALLRQLQLSDTISMKIEKSEDGEKTEISFQPHNQDEEIKAKSLQVRKLLGLDPTAARFKVVFGVVQADDKEIAMATRSILQILGESSVGVEVPEAHVKDGRVLPSVKPTLELGPANLVRIHSGAKKPDENDVYASIYFKKHWFWVDDRDRDSKRGLAFLMILATLAEAGTSISPPVLTISKP